MSKLKVHVSNQVESLEFDRARLKQAVAAILTDEGIGQATVSVAIVDDPTIHRLNRQFLEHDYPTDVLSFLLERSRGRLEGEIVVSIDTATRTAAEIGWKAADELLLYVIHGALHLVGFDDRTPRKRSLMRAAERRWLAQFGITQPVTNAKSKRLPSQSGRPKHTLHQTARRTRKRKSGP